MKPSVKYEVIYCRRKKYPVSVMCNFFIVSRSGYYDYVKRRGNPQKDAPLAELVAECQKRCGKTYGYRRVQLWLMREKTLGYFDLTQRYGITPSMSRRGNCYDNATAENFFSILKTECIYRHKLTTLNEAGRLIDEYIDFCNNERIQTKTSLTPLEKRRQAASFNDNLR